ncbi:Dihydropteroate synthase, partial [Sistotremastrum suecicum HHB10207 ss-3]
LSPLKLLQKLKNIESTVGRVKTFRNGPRVVDLDIIFYNDEIFDSRAQGVMEEEGHLIVPHVRMHEREFVLRPCADIIPHYIHPLLGYSIADLLGQVANPQVPIRKILPLPPLSVGTERCWILSKKTYIMATLNVTPDSFSDGGQHSSIEDAVTYVHNSVAQGADIIDIGGYSTRPGAAFVSPEEELRRVVPVIQRLREQGLTVPISVDTFRASVADAALAAGADIINDVRALDEDPAMRAVAGKRGVPVILMHSRPGDAGKNKGYGDLGGVITGVKRELGEKVSKARRTPGIRRWNVVVDPGIGFNKSVEDNLTLLRHHATLTDSGLVTATPQKSLRAVWEDQQRLETERPMEGMPTLIGASRKSFLGRVIGDPDRDPSLRAWATAAAVTVAVQQKTDIVRVHDIKEMKDVLAIADAVWRAD